MKLSGTSTIGQNGHLMIGGMDTVELAEQYGTPLYVYDIALIRERARTFREAFERHQLSYQVAYASKAFSSIAMAQLAAEEGLSLDVVSGGELYTALQANFPVERIHFHGNNKSQAEIAMALEAGIGCFVVDNFYEVHLLKEEAMKRQITVPIMLRTTPGVEAHTHDFITTGQEDSKFGFDLNNGQADRAVEFVLQEDVFQLLGVHSHIGSQIFETDGFELAARKLFGAVERWVEQFDYMPAVLNLGGGFGIRYNQEDEPLPYDTYITAIAKTVKEEALRLGVEPPEVWIEPGRSLVGDAGTTLYTVGSHKEVPNIRHYIAVDGGMTDNLRPALYGAKYEAMLANRASEANIEPYSIAGKCCESGDMLIWDMPLPEPKHDDVLAVFSTGAYGYSMSNNYNRLPRPAVVFVENGKAQEVVKRETYEDLVQHDRPLERNATVES